jgi:PKD repeat protein
MKKKLLYLMTMVFCALSFIVQAQNLPCSLKAKFDFKADKCKISFSDFSAAATGTTITNWSWDFGDATTSTLQNPTHVYTASGTYTVCLTITGNNGQEKCSNKFCLPVTVQGCEQVQPCGVKPLFKFKVDKCTVYFTDFSGTNAGTTITNWYWTFGDATTSTLQNPIHTYVAPGTYSVCLITVAVNTAGQQCKNEYCYPVTVEGCGDVPFCKLAAKFDFKVDKCTVSFADLSAAGAGTTITSWFWDFGDATTSTLQNPTHVYTTAGTYNVCLVIVGTTPAGKQCKDKICTTVTVQGCGQTPDCKLAAKFQFKTSKCKVGFSDLSVAGVGTTITNWLWDFGDATTSTLQNPTHVYAASGTYTVCLTIVGNNGVVKCTDKFCLKVTVEGCGQIEPCKLAAKFDFKVDKCNVSFTDLSAVGLGTTITNWYWDFGDATTSTLQNPSHVYTTAGTYSVCLIIVGTNAAGEQCKDQFCKKVKVEGCGQGEPCKVAAKFDFKVDKCKVGFMDLSAVGVGTTITNWYWDFGDATTSTLQNPTHVYAAAGTYSVCLTIVGTNAAGQQCKDQFCKKVKVEGCGQVEPCKLAAKYSYKVDSCTAYFSDFSAAGAGTTITNWYWDFGDATTSTLQNPVHVYTAAGTYTVCLVIVGANAAGEQCKDKYCSPITVFKCGDSQPCQVYAKFDFKIDSCKVYFADFSSTGAGTTFTNWYWEFGDGNISGNQNPTHSYLAPGTYTVCLRVSGVNAAGSICEDKLCQQITVKDCGQVSECKLYPKFDFKIDSCKVSFADVSGAGAGTTITDWYWDFGDGNTSISVQNPSHVYTATGTYTVCLTIAGVNANGEQCKRKICDTVAVQECGITCKLDAKFGYKIDSCNVYFADYSSTGAGTTITSWFWNFDDGNLSALQNPSHVYAASGTYNVCLTIIGVSATGQQCKNRICNTITVKCGQDKPCEVYAKFDYKVDGCGVYFTDYSGTGVGTTLTNWFWNFGDGNTSTLQNPSHIYAAPGTYEVCLVVVGVNAAGVKCENRLCLKIIVKDCGQTSDCKLYPKFDFKTDSCNVSFFDFSGAAAGTTITNRFWNFGDGNTSTLQTPTHVYAASGTYTVCLLITGVNAAGIKCENKICLPVTVSDCPKHHTTVAKANASLLSIYPNPANDLVNIGFRLNVAGQVNITVSDVQGRIVAVVKDGYYTYGYHTIVWNADVHAGWYLVTIKTAEGTDQKQLLIQK